MARVSPARQGMEMQAAAAEGLAELQRLLTSAKRSLHMSPGDIARLAEIGCQLVRYARGEDEEQLGSFGIRVRIDDPPPDSAEDLAGAKAAIEAALRGR
jgi:hypothetical protein